MTPILLRSDFHNLLDTLASRKIGVNIIAKIDDWHQVYCTTNSNCLLQLLEEMEIKYPEISYRKNFFNENLLFEEWDEEGYSQIEYAYSYIIAKLDAVIQKSILGSIRDDVVKVGELPKPERALICIITDDEKKQLFEELVKKDGIEGYENEDFLFMLSGIEIGEFGKKMIWKFKHKQDQANYRLLHQILYKICPIEFSNSKSYFQKLCYFISRQDGKPFLPSVERSFTKQNNNGDSFRCSDFNEMSRPARSIIELIDSFGSVANSRVQGNP